MFKNQLPISTTSLWKYAIENFNFKRTKNYTLKAFKMFVVVSARILI